MNSLCFATYGRCHPCFNIDILVYFSWELATPPSSQILWLNENPQIMMKPAANFFGKTWINLGKATKANPYINRLLLTRTHIFKTNQHLNSFFWNQNSRASPNRQPTLWLYDLCLTSPNFAYCNELRHFCHAPDKAAVRTILTSLVMTQY